jgi:hypothetical protein
MRLIKWENFGGHQATIITENPLGQSRGTTYSFETPREKFLALEQAIECSMPGFRTSSLVVTFNNFHYNQILGMGMLAAPFLIERLAKGEVVWCGILRFMNVFPTDVPLIELMDSTGPINPHLWVNWAKELVNAHCEAEVKETCQDIHEAWSDIATSAREISKCKGS